MNQKTPFHFRVYDLQESDCIFKALRGLQFCRSRLFCSPQNMPLYFVSMPFVDVVPIHRFGVPQGPDLENMNLYVSP